MRNFLTFLIASAVVAGAASSYRIVDLGEAGGGGYAINDSRQVVVYQSSLEFAVWENGVHTPLPGGFFANRNNARGQVVGSYYPTLVSPIAYVWDRGSFTPVGLPDGATASQGLGINNRGQVVGHFSGPDAVLHAFLWEKGGFTKLPEGPTGQASMALAISDSGLVVGWVRIQGLERPAFWEHGRLTVPPLPWVQPPTAHARGWAFDVNNRGDFLVWGPVYYLWSKGTYTTLPVSASAINESGLIACEYYAPCVWDYGERIDLPTLGGSYHEVRAINNNGDVAGLSRDINGVYHAVMWVRE